MANPFKAKLEKSIGSETKPTISFKIINALDRTWGYDIYISKKLVIHQMNIPGQTGDHGFRTKKQAEAVARLVVAKVRKGEMPPSVTQAELAKLRMI